MKATDIDPDWVKRLAQTLKDGGYAFRKGANRTIEIKSLTTNQWLPKALPNGTITNVRFDTEKDRDQIYNALRELSKIDKLAEWKRREKEVQDALADGHPNPEGYLEWWYADNPKPDA